MKDVKVADVCEAIGLGLISTGFLLWSFPIGIIVGGVSLLSWGIATGRRGS